MPNYSFFDVGACNCGCACYPCTLPATNLHITFHNSGTGFTQNGTLIYTAPCTWATAIGVFFTDFSISCAGGCTYFASNSGITVSYFDHPTNCSGIAGAGGIPFGSFTWTCSPLNIVCANGTFSWTITL